MCAAPNEFGSNLTKAQIAILIDATGKPIDQGGPAQVELIYNGQPVSNANPLPAVSIT